MWDQAHPMGEFGASAKMAQVTAGHPVMIARAAGRPGSDQQGQR